MKKLLSIGAMILTMIISPRTALAAGEQDLHNGYYTLCDAQGNVLTRIGCAISPGDVYIAGDNTRYSVFRVDNAAQTAYASQEAMQSAMTIVAPTGAQSQKNSRRVALYCTHSDESYIPSDGTASTEENGGIFDVAQALADEFASYGVQATLSEENHYPHDSAAYNRSRSTAIDLLREMPSAIFDIHRDGVPAEEYETEVEGQPMSMVRLLVGRSNQNRESNEEFAIAIKKTADEMYPGLIKDIFIGKGNYNQDLAPNSVLLEFGTHEIEKEAAIESTKHMAEVLTVTLYGTTEQGSASAPSASSAPNPAGDASQARRQDSDRSLHSLWWLLGGAIALGLVFVLVTQGGRNFAGKIGRGISEMTAGLFGKRKSK